MTSIDRGKGILGIFCKRICGLNVKSECTLLSLQKWIILSQRIRISKSFYNYAQLSRYWGDNQM